MDVSTGRFVCGFSRCVSFADFASPYRVLARSSKSSTNFWNKYDKRLYKFGENKSIHVTKRDFEVEMQRERKGKKVKESEKHRAEESKEWKKRKF